MMEGTFLLKQNALLQPLPINVAVKSKSFCIEVQKSRRSNNIVDNDKQQSDSLAKPHQKHIQKLSAQQIFTIRKHKPRVWNAR